MNGYISDSLNFTNAQHSSLKYQKKIESYLVLSSNAYYFIDDLFNMLLFNKSHFSNNGKCIQIRIITGTETVSDFNNNRNDNTYYSYYHKNFKKQRFLLSNPTDKTRDYREFYGARIKLKALDSALKRN